MTIIAAGIGVARRGTHASGAVSQLGKGKLLVASRQLLDPNFAETVILLLDYSSTSAMGVIINRPTDVRLTQVLPDLEHFKGRRDAIFLGGPVSPRLVLVLVHTRNAPPSSQLIVGNIYLTGSVTTLQRLFEEKTPPDHVHAYAGYAGWGAGQLDHEVERGDWHVFSADVETIFTTPSKDVWKTLLQRSSGDWVRAPQNSIEKPSDSWLSGSNSSTRAREYELNG